MSQKLEYELKGKSDVDQVTGRAKKSVESLGESFRKVGDDISGRLARLFSATVLLDKGFSFISNTFREFAEVADEVERSGISSDQFQRLAYAAQQSGVSVATLAKATRQLRVDMAEAASGNKQMLELFNAIGISMEQIKAGDVASVFLAISAALSDSASDSDKMLIATTFFGDKIGNDILPLLGEMRKLQKDIAEAPIVDDATLKKIAEYEDGMNRLTVQAKTFLATLFKINDFLNPGPGGIDPKTGKYVPAWRMREIKEEKAKEEAAAAALKTKGASKPIIEAIQRQAEGKQTKEKETKTEKDKAADTKGQSVASSATSVSGNVIGVGQNPVVSAIHEQVEIAKQQLEYLRMMATRTTASGTSPDLTNKGAVPQTPATSPIK